MGQEIEPVPVLHPFLFPFSIVLMACSCVGVVYSEPAGGSMHLVDSKRRPGG